MPTNSVGFVTIKIGGPNYNHNAAISFVHTSERRSGPSLYDKDSQPLTLSQNQ